MVAEMSQSERIRAQGNRFHKIVVDSFDDCPVLWVAFDRLVVDRAEIRIPVMDSCDGTQHRHGTSIQVHDPQSQAAGEAFDPAESISHDIDCASDVLDLEGSKFSDSIEPSNFPCR